MRCPLCTDLFGLPCTVWRDWGSPGYGVDMILPLSIFFLDIYIYHVPTGTRFEKNSPLLLLSRGKSSCDPTRPNGVVSLVGRVGMSQHAFSRNLLFRERVDSCRALRWGRAMENRSSSCYRNCLFLWCPVLCGTGTMSAIWQPDVRTLETLATVSKVPSLYFVASALSSSATVSVYLVWSNLRPLKFRGSL